MASIPAIWHASVQQARSEVRKMKRESGIEQERIGSDITDVLDQYFTVSERLIPGLWFLPGERVPLPARFDPDWIQNHLAGRPPMQTLTASFHGLTFQPHHPQLWYLVACALFDLCAPRASLRTLGHVLWLYPRHQPAWTDAIRLAEFLNEPVPLPYGG